MEAVGGPGPPANPRREAAAEAPTPDVAILTHADDRLFRRTNYLVHALAREWEAMGLRVAVLRGTAASAPAGVLLPHVDLTTLPPEYVAFAGRYPRVVNRAINDISKSSFSENLVPRGSAEAGPVIVKTDRNHGGMPELRFRLLPRLRRLLAKWKPRTDWQSVEVLDTGSYPVFATAREVPEAVFGNPRLIVERFLPEREDGRYAVRYCYALGRREVTVRLTSAHPVIKASNSLACVRVEGSSEISRQRRRLGLDYGKLDYVVRDGKAVLLDVNATPAAGTLDRYGMTEEVARELAEGIRDV